MNGQGNSLLMQEENFELSLCSEIEDIERRPEYKKLNLTPSQKIQIGGLFQQMPAVMATEVMCNAYILRFPEGIAKTCQPMQYQNGLIGTALQGSDGRIVAHASLESLSPQVAVLGTFNAMSIASGQYFLAQINNELKTINQNVDKILEFLYGDKKAELLAEVSFTKYAYQNYSSIMDHEPQRLATIVGLQEARKIAMKDIEFYMSDLDLTVNAKGNTDLEELVGKTMKTKECLFLSMQLYSMSSLLEVYYAQNYDADYIRYLEEDANNYMTKCENRMLSDFSMLKTLISTHKGVMKKVNKPALLEPIDQIIGLFSSGQESIMRKSLRQALHASEQKAEYYIKRGEEVYLKVV